jgi:FMN phosphatase YigB (HAD superfamily)
MSKLKKVLGRSARRKKVVPVVVLFDVDNTLLDNDSVGNDLHTILRQKVGSRRAKAYWQGFEELRTKLGYADYLGALQNYRKKFPHDVHLLQLSRLMIDYPFRRRLYPNALKVVGHFRRAAGVAVLSDGDVVFQPHKVRCSGIEAAVDCHVLIYVHKESELKDVQRCLPAEHYVLVDDKIRILAAVKKIWKRKVTTVFVRQGHYALDKALVAKYPPADMTIGKIGDLLKFSVEELRSAAV